MEKDGLREAPECFQSLTLLVVTWRLVVITRDALNFKPAGAVVAKQTVRMKVDASAHVVPIELCFFE
jgi:hypothetical protein